MRNTHETGKRLTARCRMKKWTSTRLTTTHLRQRMKKILNCSNNAIKPPTENLRCLAKKQYSNNGMTLETSRPSKYTQTLVRRLAYQYKQVYSRLIITRKHRYTRPMQIKRNIIARHGILLAKKRLHTYKHVDVRHTITYESRCTRSQRVGVNIGKGNNTTPTRTVSRRVRGKRGRRHNGDGIARGKR